MIVLIQDGAENGKMVYRDDHSVWPRSDKIVGFSLIIR